MLKTLLPAFTLAILIDPLSKTCHRNDALRYHSPLCCHSLLRYQLPVSSSHIRPLVLLVNCFPLLHNIHTLFSLVSLCFIADLTELDLRRGGVLSRTHGVRPDPRPAP